MDTPLPAWWQFGLQREALDPPEFAEIEENSSDKSAMEANPKNVVCFTSEFEAAPIFPLPNLQTNNQYNDVYVYVMALPEATIPDNFKNEEPQEYPNIEIFDLHTLQIRQTKNILQSHPEANPLYVAQTLCGYEAFARRVLPEQIICVVKCKRSDLINRTAESRVLTTTAGDNALSFDRLFQMESEILCNPNADEKTQSLKTEAIENLKTVWAKGVQPTKNVADALNASGIDYVKNNIYTASFFWDELVHLNFLSASKSVFESSRCFFVQLSHWLTGQTIFDSNENKTLKIHDFSPSVESSSVKPVPQKGLLSSLSLWGRVKQEQENVEHQNLPQFK